MPTLSTGRASDSCSSSCLVSEMLRVRDETSAVSTMATLMTPSMTQTSFLRNDMRRHCVLNEFMK